MQVVLRWDVIVDTPTVNVLLNCSYVVTLDAGNRIRGSVLEILGRTRRVLRSSGTQAIPETTRMYRPLAFRPSIESV